MSAERTRQPQQNDLTTGQVLRAFVDLSEATGFPPTVREVLVAVGARSTQTVHAHLQRAEELGYLRGVPGKFRARLVTDEGRAFARRVRPRRPGVAA